MLVLTRKVGQSVTIEVAGGITISVLWIATGLKGGEPQVRLAFTCPREIRVKRDEAQPAMGADQASAAFAASISEGES